MGWSPLRRKRRDRRPPNRSDISKKGVKIARTGLSRFGRLLTILTMCGLFLAGSSTAWAAHFLNAVHKKAFSIKDEP